jgi:hypothetical protein
VPGGAAGLQNVDAESTTHKETATLIQAGFFRVDRNGGQGIDKAKCASCWIQL